MKYDFKLEVTEKHIAEGCSKCHECPLALSAREFFAPALALGIVSDVWVGSSGILRVQLGKRNCPPGEMLAFEAAWAERFVERFDRGQHVAAQTFYFKSVP